MNPESSNTKPAVVSVQDLLYFRCRMCGECCSSWNIPIEGEKARALQNLPWVQERLKEKRRELVKVTEALYRLPLTDENVCVFLEEKRCLVELNEGLALKPEECQRFPFASVSLPDGKIAYDTSASCKIVAEEMLTAFQSILPLPGREPVINEEAFPGKIPVNGFKKWSFSEYLVYQAALKPLFQDQNTGTPEALKQVQRMLVGNPISCQQSSECKPVNDWFQPQSVFVFHELWEWMIPVFFLRKPYGSLSWLALLRGRQYDDPRVFGYPVTLKNPSDFIWAEGSDALIKAFAYNLLTRKVLLTHGHSLSGMLAMACVGYFLVRWYASILAQIQERNKVAVEDTSMAIRLVERYYTGHQPRFLAFFDNLWRSELLGRLILGR